MEIGEQIKKKPQKKNITKLNINVMKSIFRIILTRIKKTHTSYTTHTQSAQIKQCVIEIYLLHVVTSLHLPHEYVNTIHTNYLPT